jgi:hypothetical protein
MSCPRRNSKDRLKGGPLNLEQSSSVANASDQLPRRGVGVRLLQDSGEGSISLLPLQVSSGELLGRPFEGTQVTSSKQERRR